MKNYTILTFISNYLPGFKSGGPVRTIANMVEHLGDMFAFRIVTSDRDVTDTRPYPNIKVDQWNSVGKAQVFYLSPLKKNLFAITDLMRCTEHNLIYLNSFFNPVFTIFPLLIRRFLKSQAKPVVIAPRGEFSRGALALKQWKKTPFILGGKITGLYNGLTWQASSNRELEDIRRHIDNNAKQIVVAPNLPPPTSANTTKWARKPHEPLQIVFLSRITPMKNLDFALRVMQKVAVPVSFNIYGPVRDGGHWKTCQELMKTLPSQLMARFHGPASPSQVPEIMAANDLFFLPTRGENYGHVIAEALSAGTPVLIADTTPWRGLAEAGVGWDFPLANINAFVRCIEQCSKLSSEEYAALRSKVKAFADKTLNNPALIEANRRLFEETIERPFSELN